MGVAYGAEIEFETKMEDFFQMVFVEGGTFQMGCTSGQGSDCDSDELPARKVTLSSYYIGKYEVTQAEWGSVMGSNPGDCPTCPVVRVSWNEVQEFIERLNAQSGLRYRLPTEAEWEFAARGGNQSTDLKYSGSNDLNEVGWFGSNSGLKIHAVREKLPNELGLYDMSGNVGEWCADWYGLYSTANQTNPVGPISGLNRVCRGGGWYSYTQHCRVSKRFGYLPGFRDTGIGFRLVRALN